MTTRTTSDIPATPADVTPEWLSATLGKNGTEVVVSTVGLVPVGTGQTGSTYRATVTYSANPSSLPTTFVIKLPSQDPEVRGKVGIAYRSEHGFYSELAESARVPIPKVYHCDTAGEGYDFVLVMEDLAPAVQGDEVAGCSVRAAELAAEAIAGLHAQFWCDPAIAVFPHVVIPKATPEVAKGVGDGIRMATDIALREFGSRLSEQDCRTLDEAARLTPAWLQLAPERFSVLHGDFRLNNVLFAPDESWISVVDWQSTTIGLPARDLSYFIVSGLMPDVRVQAERDLVGVYHRALLAQGVQGYDLETCWRDYRLGVMQLNLIATLGYAFTSTPTHRSEDMMHTLFTRSCRAIRDLRTLELIRELSV
ncbi:phosphotransferase family protein [Nocardia pseudovaccinii]|uniref:phosphotransferase family protein n=1 Tax=Nocardia pseudovaccinii TaxID=189540 RepID=UPI0007A4D3DD|nr:aminoglycoside phosphotransferase family protein [Nocardia pseudovaccinii]